MKARGTEGDGRFDSERSAGARLHDRQLSDRPSAKPARDDRLRGAVRAATTTGSADWPSIPQMHGGEPALGDLAAGPRRAGCAAAGYAGISHRRPSAGAAPARMPRRPASVDTIAGARSRAEPSKQAVRASSRGARRLCSTAGSPHWSSRALELRNRPARASQLRGPAAARSAGRRSWKRRRRAANARRRNAVAETARCARPDRGTAEEQRLRLTASRRKRRRRSMRWRERIAALETRDCPKRFPGWKDRPRRCGNDAQLRRASTACRRRSGSTRCEAGLKTTSGVRECARSTRSGRRSPPMRSPRRSQSGAPYAPSSRRSARPRARRGDAVRARAAGRRRPADARRAALRLRGGGGQYRRPPCRFRQAPARSTGCSAARAASSRCVRPTRPRAAIRGRSCRASAPRSPPAT